MSTINSLKKQFILDTLVPYFEDRQTRGYNEDSNLCQYLTKEGKKCAVGKHMREGSWQKFGGNFKHLIESEGHSMEEVLTEEAYAIGLSPDEWTAIQEVHDNIKVSSCLLLSYITILEEETNENFEELRLININ
jgi:hypothetical protein